MHSQKDAQYRLTLAEGFLKEAKQDLELERFRSCVDNSQLSVENSGKAIISIFEPVEKSHDPAAQLARLIKNKIIRPDLAKPAEEILPLFEELGPEEHFLSDYGDETSFKNPWELFKQEDAEQALKIAQKCFAAARKIYQEYFKV